MLNTARFAEKSAVHRSWCTSLFYICNYEYRMRLGIAKSEMGFPLVFALAFRYICSQSDMFEKTTAKSADSIIYPTNKIRGVL